MKKIGLYIIIAAISIVTSGCINIKSDYPDISYYTITPDKDSLISDYMIDGSVLVRAFDISNSYDTDYITVMAEKKVKKFFYHRWADNFDKLATDYIIQAFIEKNLFSKGVYSTSTYVVPDYILEAYIIQVKNVYDEENDDNYSEVKIKFNMLRRLNKTSEPINIFNKEFSSKVHFEDDKVKYIAPAINKAMKNITNKLFETISEFE